MKTQKKKKKCKATLLFILAWLVLNQNHARRIWQIMKEISGAEKFKLDYFPKKMKETEITVP